MSLKRWIQFTLLTSIILCLCMMAAPSYAQKRSKISTKYFKKHYSKGRVNAARQCHALIRKKKKKPHKPFMAGIFKSNKPAQRSMAEVDLNDTPPPAPKPAPKPVVAQKTTPKPEPAPKPEPEKKENVLAMHNLPEPTSPQQEEIRAMVQRNLSKNLETYPIELDPLYFTFDQDEFSVVDMEPFLVAVEYALQGRTILIEGHTDKKGNDNYNVQLSIQRVERIRQLMHDMGVPDDRISVVGYGEENASTDLSEDSRQKDRRVDFKVF